MSADPETGQLPAELRLSPLPDLTNEENHDAPQFSDGGTRKSATNTVHVGGVGGFGRNVHSCPDTQRSNIHRLSTRSLRLPQAVTMSA